MVLTGVRPDDDGLGDRPARSVRRVTVPCGGARTDLSEPILKSRAGGGDRGEVHSLCRSQSCGPSALGIDGSGVERAEKDRNFGPSFTHTGSAGPFQRLTSPRPLAQAIG